MKKTKNDLNLVFFVDFKCAFVCLEYVFAYCCLFPYYYKQKKYFAHNDNKVTILTLFRMGFFEAARGLGGGGQTRLYLTQRRSKKYMNHVTQLLSSADISIFSREISKFCYITKYRYRLYFDT